MSKPHENNLNEELIELIEAVADSADWLCKMRDDGDDGQIIEAGRELSEAKKALYDYYK
jgi:hypothetical protein